MGWGMGWDKEFIQQLRIVSVYVRDKNMVSAESRQRHDEAKRPQLTLSADNRRGLGGTPSNNSHTGRTAFN